MYIYYFPANSLSRIVNGQDASILDHPHQVSLEYVGWGHICGASIVSPRWVLTAAHCVEGGSAATFAIATNAGSRDSERTVYSVKSLIMHPKYNRGSGAYPNDIALLELAEPINLQDNQHRAISIAGSKQSFVGQICEISGWGNLYGGAETVPNVLQETDGVILSSSQCASVWGSNIVDAIHICIHNDATGSCQGDSGGPMVCGGVLAGVTSWGASGCFPEYPSVYTKVSNYYSWIMRYIEGDL